MRIIGAIICLFALGISSASAYIEERDIDKIDAGEHNTNLYKLNSRGAVTLKKLKKIDETITRREKYNKPVEAYNLERILSSDEEDNNRYTLENISSSLDESLSNPQNLKTADDPEMHSRLMQLRINNVKDAAVVNNLRTELKRSRR